MVLVEIRCWYSGDDRNSDDSCNTELYELDTTGMRGIDIACAGYCKDCNSPTYGVSGDPDATQRAISVISEMQGRGEVIAGMEFLKR